MITPEEVPRQIAEGIGDGSSVFPAPLIVIGMHRSGTSLAAALLQSAGLDVGERLMEGNWSNPRGHFEDMDFVELQRGALVRLGWHQDGWLESELQELPEDIISAARDLVDRKGRNGRPWGWKDPRTILFLRLWLDLLPSSKLALIYRAPWEVIDSLYRRGDEIFSEDPGLAVRIWLRYNRALLDVAHMDPARCLLVNLETLAAHPREWVAAAGELAGIRLAAPDVSLYDATLLHGSEASVRAGALFRYYPETVELYSALESRSWRPSEVEATPPWARGPTIEAERALAIHDWHGSCHISAESKRARDEIRRAGGGAEQGPPVAGPGEEEARERQC
jgi:hypothetical protein